MQHQVQEAQAFCEQLPELSVVLASKKIQTWLWAVLHDLRKMAAEALGGAT